MRKRESEDKLHVSVAQYLDVALPIGSMWFHVPNEGKRTGAEAGRLKAFGMMAGIPDITIIHEGRAHFIELKTPRGSLSADQRATIGALQVCGCMVHICRSITDVQLALAAFGIGSRARVAA